MKRLFVWLASVSICAAQAVSIGPFATEDWVDERLHVLTNDFATVPYVDDAVGDVEDKIPDVSGFATKAYVDAVSNAIPDVSTFSTVEYVNTTSNNLAILIDDLVSEEELGSSVSNIVPGWALVPVSPVTAEVDPAFTNWLATTNVVIDDNVGTFVSNMVPSWALVPIPPVTIEVDPAFTNWLATTNSATVQYVDAHKWDWGTQVTNAPAFPTYSDAMLYLGSGEYNLSIFPTYDDTTLHIGQDYDLSDFPTYADTILYMGSEEYDLNDFPTYADGATLCLGDFEYNLRAFPTYSESTLYLGDEAHDLRAFPTYSESTLYLGDEAHDLAGLANESIQLSPDYTAFTLRYVPNGSRTFYYDGTNSTVGLFMVDSKGEPYISTCNGQYAMGIDPVFFDNKHKGFEDIYGNNVRVDTTAFSPTCFMDNSNSNRYMWLTTNGVLKAGTVATVEDLAGFITTEADPVFNEWTNRSVLVAGSGAISTGTDFNSTVLGDNAKACAGSTLAVGNNVTARSLFDVAVGVYETEASGGYSTAVGSYAKATGDASIAIGCSSTASGENSVVIGSSTSATHPNSVSIGTSVSSHGPGTFNINPVGGAAGVWIGETNLAIHLEISSKLALDAIAPAFSTSSVYTNGDYVIYEQHLYECTNYTGTAGWRPGDWQQTTVTGMLGNLRKILDAINGEAL